MNGVTLTRRLVELRHEPTAEPGGRPVVAVRSAQQAAELLGLCHTEGWRVRIQGAGTRSHDRSPADLVISARDLTGFDIYEPDDLTVGALAGTTHRHAAADLARHQQLLPIDPPGAAAATLGGTFASGQAGPLRAGYGTPRDFALGVTLVTGDGRLLRLGGQVVKNVAGYDLVRLVVGSRGTLGLIAQLHVRLRSLPQRDVTILAGVPDPGAGAALALALRDAIAPVAIELLGPDPAHPSCRLAIRLHGSAETVAGALDSAASLLPDSRVVPTEAAAAFWQALSIAEAGAAVRFRFRALPAALPTLAAAASHLARSWSDNASGDWAWAAHAADGVLRLWRAPAAPTLAPLPAGPPAELRSMLASVSGTSICEVGPEAIRGPFSAPPPTPRLAELERELRLRFDPGHVLVGD